MQEAYVNQSPLIRSTVHTTFHRAVKGIGLPDFPEQVFFEEITRYLQSPLSIFEEDDKEKLWRAVLHGDIVATEIWDDAKVFYVRGTVGTRVMDIRLVFKSHQWRIQSVISMTVQPLLRLRMFHRLATAGAIVIAAAIGFALHQPSQSAASPAPAVAVTTPTSLNSSNEAQSHKMSSSASIAENQPAKTTGRASEHTPSGTLSFTLTPGMSLHEISRFLSQHHLVKHSIQFDMLMKRMGIDRNIRPGTFTFKTGMSENQLIEVLRHHS